ncbi:MAG: hypothetical protein JSU08_17130 [Acidobacteria bacterium]|nr:hypothetical protein [Acidobacteriota bacterium]
MTAWDATLAGGLLGTIVLTTMLRAASELRLTRMDLPFLVGTAFSERRDRAKALGYIVHFVLGMVFAFPYAWVFRATGHAGVLTGAALGLLHAAFVSTTLVNVILPLVHPRIGTPDTAADGIPLLEPPGFLMLNYGHRTFIVTLAAHAGYGAIVGWACANMI